MSNYKAGAQNKDYADQEMDMVEREDGAANVESQMEPKVKTSRIPERTKRYIIGGVLALLLIIILVIVLAVTLGGSKKTKGGKKLRSEEIFLLKSKYMRGFQVNWHKDNLIYPNPNEEGDIITLNVTTNTATVFIPKEYSPRQKLLISADMTAFLNGYDHIRGFRHSGASKYNATKIGTWENVIIGKKGSGVGSLDYIVWSPVGRGLLFVQDRSVFVTRDPFDLTTNPVLKASDPANGNISYGVSDWLYEEEVLHTNVACWWNPTGTAVAYLKFDDGRVKDFNMYLYGNSDDLYGSYTSIKYPKAGQNTTQNNPVVKLQTFILASNKIHPDILKNDCPEDWYISLVRWIDANCLLVGCTNRPQTTARLFVCKVDGSVPCRKVFEEVATTGWVDINKQDRTEPIPDPTNKRVFITLVRKGKDGDYKNVAALDYNKTRSINNIKWIGSGSYSVFDIVRYEHDMIYFTAAYPNPTQRNLLSASVNGGKFQCLTCDDPQCTYNKIYMANTATPCKESHCKSNDVYIYFVQLCQGPSITTYILKKILPTGRSVVTVQVLEDNKKLKDALAEYAIPSVDIKKITLRKGTPEELDVWTKLVLPEDGYPDSGYPLILNVYAGPGVQRVTTKFELSWFTYLAASRGIAYLMVDGRGTGGRERSFEAALRGNISVVEIQDQLDAVREVVETVKNVDKDKVGAFGWSYGGFAVGHLLGRADDKMIRCGVSVAPVTDFRYYDTAYTERFLGHITSNRKAYERTNIWKNAENFKGKEFLLVHGMGDDNVHFGNSAHLIRGLVLAGIQFQVMVYPDENHRIPIGRDHLYQKATIFFEDCFNRRSSRYKILEE